MKILDKKVVMEWGVGACVKGSRNQYEHTLTERRIMGDCEHPFLVWSLSNGWSPV